jgi:hypothetical protein
MRLDHQGFTIFEEDRGMKMSTRTRINWKVVLIVAVVLVGAYGFNYVFHNYIVGSWVAARWHNRIAREVEERKIRLLVETDPQALLEACRELSRRHPGGLMDANDLQLPEIIVALQPNYVSIDRHGVVEIGMYTGRWPFGINALPEDLQESEKERAQHERRGRMLVEGLWYFEYGYWNDPAGYDRRIDELLSKYGKDIPLIVEGRQILRGQ